MSVYQIFWGETHHNTYQFGQGQTPSPNEICVRVEQRNGQRAWFSPIWVSAA
jgi:hypothetical protein